MATQIGIGVVGLDHWYTAFGALKEANENPATRLVAIADTSGKRLKEVSEKNKADYTTTNFGAVIADPVRIREIERGLWRNLPDSFPRMEDDRGDF